MKKIISTTLAIGITVTSLTAPTYAVSFKDLNNHWAKSSVEYLIANGIASGFSDGTFKPNKTISNGEFMSMVLKAMKVTVDKPQEDEKWDAPIMRKALEIGIVKTGEPMTNSSQNITREQTATVLYRVLQQTEKLGDYYGQYDYPLEHMLTDFSKISKNHLAGVAMMFQQGIMLGAETKSSNSDFPVRLISPQSNLTRAEMSVVMAKVMDKGRRLGEDEVSRLRQVKSMVTNDPKVSQAYVTMPFENGKPVIDKAVVIKQLEKTPYNTRNTGFYQTLKWDDYINKEWTWDRGIEHKTQTVTELFDASRNALEKHFNVSYKDDLKNYDKEFRYFLSQERFNDDYAMDHLEWIKNQKITLEGIVVTDKSLFYSGSDGPEKRTKMRLYFKCDSPVSKTTKINVVPFNTTEKVTLNSNQWYQVDLEICSALQSWQGDLKHKWHSASQDKLPTMRDTWMLSDFIPIKMK